MRHTLKLPKLGDTVDDVVILDWRVAVGDQIAHGDPMVLVETDKAEVEVPAPVSGHVLEILVAVNDDVPTGAPIAVLED